MDGYIKAVAVALIASVIGLVLAKQNKDTALLLTIMACGLILIATMGYLRTITDFLATLEMLIGLEGDHFRILIKIVGIGLLSEVASMICSDAGNGSLGKSLQILATVLILCLSIPLLQQLLALIRGILEGL